MTAVHNFNAGPSILPKTVFEEASKAILNFNDIGLSILEIGHRTSIFQAVMDEARALVKELMLLDDDHAWAKSQIEHMLALMKIKFESGLLMTVTVDPVN